MAGIMILRLRIYLCGQAGSILPPEVKDARVKPYFAIFTGKASLEMTMLINHKTTAAIRAGVKLVTVKPLTK